MEQKDNNNRFENLLSEFPIPTKEEWRNATDKLLKGKPYDKIMLTKTYEGIQLEPIYWQDNFEKLELKDNLPGTENYLRSTNLLGYRGKEWNIAQEIPYAFPDEFNQALLHDLNSGQNSVNIILDEPSYLSQDPNQSREGEVGKNGVSIANLEDLELALKDVLLDIIHLDINAELNAAEFTSLVIAFAKKNNFDLSKLSANIGYDPIKFLLTNGKLPKSIDSYFDEMYKLTKWVNDQNLNIRTISVSGLDYCNAGASAVDELTFVFSTATLYIKELIKRGLNIDQIAGKIKFEFGIGQNFFMEISKLRSARVLWTNIVSAFGGSDESKKMFIHAKSSLINKTKYDPYVNMLRTTTEAFSAILSGVDSICTTPFDSIFGKPTEFSRRIARNQQIILKEEVKLENVIDPAGGSWFVEELTNQIIDTVWGKFQAIEKKGNFLSSIKESYPQNIIKETAEKRLKNILIRRDVVVGTNMFANNIETPLEFREPDFKNIFKVRSEYYSNYKKPEIEIKDFNIDEMISAFEKGATLNQVYSSLENKKDSLSVNTIKTIRLTEIFEELRDNMESYKKENGKAANICLLNIGTISEYKGRSDFSKAFFEVGGFNVIQTKADINAITTAKEALTIEDDVFVICSSDKNYENIVPEVCKYIKAEKPKATIVLAGYPKDKVEDYSKSGVDLFIHARANSYELNKNIQVIKGVIK